MKTVCLDFDGVMNTYDGWKGEDELFMPRPGVTQFLIELQREGYAVVVCSTRPAAKIKAWLVEHLLDKYVADVLDRKPPAVCYVDDRGIRFDGDFYATLQAIKSFRVFWEH